MSANKRKDTILLKIMQKIIKESDRKLKNIMIFTELHDTHALYSILCCDTIVWNLQLNIDHMKFA